MKIFTGKVVSTKMAKTATVRVNRLVAHPIYKKRMRRSRLFHVHDEESKAKLGETVFFVASKPVSRLKRWKLVLPSEKITKTKSKVKGRGK